VAHHASALKQMRQSLKNRARNRQNLAKLKTQVKKFRAVVANGDAEAAKALLSETVSEIDRAAKKGIVHDNAAARYKSRLSRRINALASGVKPASNAKPAKTKSASK
jgi:small subunit ribosomal protein S20